MVTFLNRVAQSGGGMQTHNRKETKQAKYAGHGEAVSHLFLL
jgi:hypothetical protein